LRFAIFDWRAARDKVRQHPGRALLIAAVALALLAAGGYFGGRHLSASRHREQARRALDDGDYPRALAELNETLRVWPKDAETHLLLARAHRLSGNQAEANRHLLRCEEAGGDRERVALESQMLEATAGRLEQEVEETLRQRVAEDHPDKRWVLEALIRGLLLRGRAEEAEKLATSWIDESPGEWRPWLLRGLARSQQSAELLSTAFAGAKDDYRRVVELRPDHPPARFLLGNAYVMTGQFREALPHLRHYHRQRPEDGAGARELAGCHRALGQVEEARRLLDGWLAEHRGTAEVYLLRGEVALDLGQPDEAVTFGRRAEALAPAQDKVLYHLARALRAQGRAKEAADYEGKWRERNQLAERLKELERKAAKEPRDVESRYEAGTIALRLGDETAGLRWFTSVLQRRPSHRPTHEALAEHFRRKGNHQAATFHRRRAAE
jgi:tetratricopeptide (TPR) repeat protein